MIRILVQGHSLVLYRNTTMTVEINNALFASPNIEGDISFSFTLPVEGNEQILDFAHLPQTDKVNKLPCSVYCNSSQNWTGELIVQKTTRDSITAALIINPYPENFASKSLSENDHGEIVISEHIETHDTAWENFLAASVSDPDVKFAPFFNQEGYGSENEHYGYWNGNARNRVVNALFYTASGDLMDSLHPFSKAHNQQLDVSVADSVNEAGEPTYKKYTEINQLAFCPQIRIARILEIWCRNAGYKFIDHLGADLSQTFLQSQKSLDGTVAQYDSETTDRISGYANGYASDIHGWQWYFNLMPGAGSEENISNASISINETGWWKFRITADFSSISRQIQCYTEVGYRAMLVIYQGDEIIYQNYVGKIDRDTYFKVNLEWKQYVNESWTASPFRIAIYFRNGQGVSRYFIDSINLENPEILMTFDAWKISADQNQTGFNIFRSKFRIPEMLPEVTNASFLKTMLETMGLCFFVSGKQKTVELVPYTMLGNAKSLDLTAHELTRETETETPEETMRTFRLSPLKDEEYNEDLRLDDAEVALPDPYANHEHYALRTKTNTLYRATKQEHETFDWVEGWEEYSGNPDKLETGNGKEESREPAVKIPHQRLFSTGRRNPDTDILTGETPQLMVADITISSDLYNTSDKPSDIILTQYRGFRQRGYATSVQLPEIMNEVMLPVWADGFALKAKGENSLGEKYVKPVLELLGHKTVTYKFRLPSMMMQAVEDLLRPSEREPSMQTRFLIVRNVKTVPKRITFQIDNDIDDTVLCQIEAVKVY